MVLSRSQLLVFLSFALSAFAQFDNGFRRRSLTGSVIAGIIVACAVGLLVLLCLMVSIRRRRHGQAILPGPAGRIGGGFIRPTAPSTNYNSGVYGSGPYGQQQGVGNPSHQPPVEVENPPPPPYSGKEDGAQTPQPGGFAPPPGPPPEAHINEGRTPWFKGNQ